MSILDQSELERSPLADLHAIAAELGIEGFRRLRRDDLIAAILGRGDAVPTATDAPAGAAASEEAPPAEEDAAAVEAQEPAAEAAAPASAPAPRGRRRRGRRTRAEEAPPEEGREPAAEAPPDEEPAAAEEVRAGVVDILPNGSGFMRARPFVQSPDDVYVSPAQIRRCELRPGDELAGPVRPPRRSERHPSLVRIDTVNGAPAEPPAERPRFEALTAAYATERLAAPDGLEAAPFGKGSRVAVADAAGQATPLLRAVAATLAERHPEVDVTIVLCGARPEDASEWRRDGAARVAGGALDEPADAQAQAAELAVERAKRVVERQGDAALVVDSLDELPAATARRVFGAARRAEEGGSLTVIAVTAPLSELARYATTTIALEPVPGGAAEGPPAVSPTSRTVRAELLGPAPATGARRASPRRASTRRTTSRTTTTRATATRSTATRRTAGKKADEETPRRARRKKADAEEGSEAEEG